MYSLQGPSLLGSGMMQAGGSDKGAAGQRQSLQKPASRRQRSLEPETAASPPAQLGDESKAADAFEADERPRTKLRLPAAPKPVLLRPAQPDHTGVSLLPAPQCIA